MTRDGPIMGASPRRDHASRSLSLDRRRCANDFTSGLILPRPLLLPDSPQRGEPKTAHDLYDEREKERDTDATIERQKRPNVTANASCSGSEVAIIGVLQVPASAPWSEHQAGHILGRRQFTAQLKDLGTGLLKILLPRMLWHS